MTNAVSKTDSLGKNPPWMHFPAGKRDLSYCHTLPMFVYIHISNVVGVIFLTTRQNMHFETPFSGLVIIIFFMSLVSSKWSEGDHKKNRPRCWFQIFVDSPNCWSQEIWFFSGTMGEGWVGMLCFILYSKSCCIKICIDWEGRKHDQYIYISIYIYMIKDNCIRITQMLVRCTFWWILLLSSFWRTIADRTGHCLQRHLYFCQVVFFGC